MREWSRSSHRQPFLKNGDGCEPLIKKDGVHHVRTKKVNGDGNGAVEAVMIVVPGELTKNTMIMTASRT